VAISQQDPRIDAGIQPDWPPDGSAPVPPTARRPSRRNGGISRGWIAASAAALIVVGAVGATVPAGAPEHQLWATATGTITQTQADP
jgi:hypothetical protein